MNVCLLLLLIFDCMMLLLGHLAMFKQPIVVHGLIFSLECLIRFEGSERCDINTSIIP